MLAFPWTSTLVYASILINNKGAMKMGLVTRRSLQLDKLFDQFAVDPKKKPPKEKEAKDTKQGKTAEKKK